MRLWIRFYEELNDFLPSHRRKRLFEVNVPGTPTVKDVIEGLGVPHTEIDLILANGTSVNFDYHPRNGERIAVYPVFESLDISNVTRLRPEPLREPKFITDAHLGTLTKYLRMLGFDTLFEQFIDDNAIVIKAEAENRIVLTRDRGLLKIRKLSRGYWIRSTDTKDQLIEVIRKFQLEEMFRPFTICMVCNGTLKKVKKNEVMDQLPEKTARYYEQFFQCKNCGRIYWKGSHYEDMLRLVGHLKDRD